jgi:hypothetical protein
MSTDPFHTPNDAGSGNGRKLPEFEGSLLILRFEGTQEGVVTDYGTKDVPRVTLFCVEGVKAGTVSEMPPPLNKRREGPRVLEDLTNEEIPNMLIFQGFVQGALRGRNPGDLVLGRLVVKDMKTKQSKDENDLYPSWILEEPTDEERQRAGAFWSKRAASRMSTPAPTASVAAPATTDAPWEA